MKADGFNKSDRHLLWSAHVYLVVPVLQKKRDYMHCSEPNVSGKFLAK